jgi:hypothetical protein
MIERFGKGFGWDVGMDGAKGSAPSGPDMPSHNGRDVIQALGAVHHGCSCWCLGDQRLATRPLI